MLKFLLILSLFVFIVFKIGGFLFRLAAGSSPQHPYRQTRTKPSDGNVHVDYVPGEKKSKGNFKGGEYVDYEEVK